MFFEDEHSRNKTILPRRTQVAGKSLVPPGCLALVFLLGTGCSSRLIQSHAVDRPIEIDARELDWQGVITPIQGKGVSIGVVNDTEYLYLSIISSKESLINQIRRTGLTVWFDPSGGKKKVLGLRYPLGMASGPPPGSTPGMMIGAGNGEGRRPGRMPGGTDSPIHDRNRPPQQDPDRSDPDPGIGSDVEVLHEDGDEQVRMRSDELKEVTVRAAMEKGAFIYELKLPLRERASSTLALAVTSGSLVGIGVEIPEQESDNMQIRMQDGSQRGGLGIRPPGGGMPGGQTRQISLKYWLRVQLQEGF